MAQNSKRRKLSTRGSGVQRLSPRQPGIAAFGRILKSASASSVIEKEVQSTTSLKPLLEKSTPETPQKRKRGAHSAFEHATVAVQTPTKGARGLLQSLSVETTPSCPSTPQSPCFDPPVRISKRRSPPSSPVSSQDSSFSTRLPTELQDLVDLYSSFLGALSLHFAHHSSNTPADISSLSLTTTRIWKKRKVGQLDIQRSLAVAQSPVKATPSAFNPTRLSLCDYGRGKICVEIVESPGRKSHCQGPLNEDQLKATFEDNLRCRWVSYKYSHSKGEAEDPTLFIAELPLARIVIPLSVTKCSPLFAKGQRRLEELLQKSSSAQGLTNAGDIGSEALAKPTTSAIKPPLSRQSSLLSRIKAKETLQASLPQPPSLEETRCRDALLRLEEIIPVFECLSSSQGQSEKEGEAKAFSDRLAPQTTSYTKSTLINSLRQSMSNPISKEEASRSIDMLGTIAPSWVTVRKIGKLESVTFRQMKGDLRALMMANIMTALEEK